MKTEPLPKKYQNITRSLVVKRGCSGFGLFTNEPIERDGFVIEYVGKILDGKGADEYTGRYLFETNKNRFIDGTARSNTARYINHSCRPNCEVEIRRGRIFIFAKRAIKAGEELNYDYGKEYVDEYIKPCRCEKCLGK